MKKKVIFVTYYWPPAGGIGVLRCLKIAKYLRSFDWEPVIFTSTQDSYQFIDDQNEVPGNIEVIRVHGFNPTETFKSISGRKKEVPLVDITVTPATKHKWLDKLGIWIRGNFFIPDARSFWARPAIRAIEEWLQRNNCHAIFSDGPPHTNTLVALKIANKYGIPWLADFQDPWTQADYYGHMKIGWIANKIHQSMERKVLQRANLVTIASPSWAVDLKELGRSNAEVLYYGYDESDFIDYRPENKPGFIVFHGGLLGRDRNPTPFIQAIAKLKDQIERDIGPLQIRLAGGVDDGVIQDFKNAGLGSNLELLGMISRKDVLLEISTSHLLILPINRAANAKGRIPGKLFELMRSQKPILALGPTDGDVSKLLEATGTGKTFTYEDYSGCQEFLSELISGSSPPFDWPKIMASDFSNEKLSAQVAEWLDIIATTDRDDHAA